MSAFFAVAYDDRVQLLTDGAIYDDDGVVRGIKEKVWRSDRAPLAVAGRGAIEGVDAMAALVIFAASMKRTFDGAIAAFQDMLDECRRRDTGEAAMVDLLIAGVSETEGPKLLYVSTSSVNGYEPFVLFDFGRECGGGPVPSLETQASLNLPERFQSGETLAELGVDLFEALRETKMAHLAHPDRPMLYAVGGHVDLTTITSEGCETRRLRTWDDRVGEKIRPKRAAPSQVAA